MRNKNGWIFLNNISEEDFHATEHKDTLDLRKEARGAGIKVCNRFGGGIVIDDIHKPDEASSDTVRGGIKEWYYNTIQSRLNDSKTPKSA